MPPLACASKVRPLTYGSWWAGTEAEPATLTLLLLRPSGSVRLKTSRPHNSRAPADLYLSAILRMFGCSLRRETAFAIAVVTKAISELIRIVSQTKLR